MRAAVHVAMAYLFLVFVGAVWPALPFEVASPNVTAVFAVYLGITARHGLFGPTAAAVIIGYVADLLSGAPRGLTALVGGLLCVVARLLTTRLLVRGRLFVGVFVASCALGASLLILAIRSAYGAGVSLGGWRALGDEAVVAIGSAILTGLVAPPLFRLCRAVDARFARTEREREAVREGYLN